MKNGIKNLLSFMIALFFEVILVFITFVLVGVGDSDIAVSAVIFGCIGYAALLLNSIFGNYLEKRIGLPMSVAIGVCTVLYVLANFILSVATYTFISVKVYLLINLILLFLYFCISVIIILTGGANIKNTKK